MLVGGGAEFHVCDVVLDYCGERLSPYPEDDSGAVTVQEGFDLRTDVI